MICDLEKEVIQKRSEKGWEYHVKNIHDPWKYMAYMCSLLEKPYEQFTGTERYIYENYKNRKINWFPKER